MKSEKDKMLAGELYQPNDPVLNEERLVCKEKLQKFNGLAPRSDQQTSLEALFASAGKGSYIVPYFYCDYGKNITVGERFFANSGCVMLDCNTIKIGNDVMIAPNVGLYTATHPIDAKTRISGLEYGLSIVIEDNVWIGAGSIVLGGVTIGKNSVVGAGSVVTKSIPANVVVVGNPANVVKKIDNEEL